MQHSRSLQPTSYLLGSRLGCLWSVSYSRNWHLRTPGLRSPTRLSGASQPGSLSRCQGCWMLCPPGIHPCTPHSPADGPAQRPLMSAVLCGTFPAMTLLCRLCSVTPPLPERCSLPSVLSDTTLHSAPARLPPVTGDGLRTFAPRFTAALPSA